MVNVMNPIGFPAPEPHYAFVQARRRNSGLTSVRWYDSETLYAADFSAKRVYRIKPLLPNPIDGEISTLDGMGQPTETDLMDLRGGVMVLSNFYTGEIGLYSIGDDRLLFERIIFRSNPKRRDESRFSIRSLFSAFSGKRRVSSEEHRKGRRIHGVVFVPGYDDLLWVSFCDFKNKGVEIITMDGRSVWSISTSEQAQDVAFLEMGGVIYAVQAARTNHITVVSANQIEMYATLYVYRLPVDLKSQPPELLTEQRFSGHLDALKAYNGRVYGANQHDNCVDEFEYSPERNRIELIRRIEGFDMPHGLDIRQDGLMAVTNYGPENDLRFLQLG